MPYRDAIEAAHARIAALESQVAELGGVDKSTSPTHDQLLGELVEARRCIDSLRKQGTERQALLASERDRAWAALERCLEVERAVWRSQADAKIAAARAEADNARARAVLLGEERVRLRDRIDTLEAEVAALLDSRPRAALHYRQAIGRTRAALRAAASERARLERGAGDEARIRALDAHSAALGRELDRLERALTCCERAVTS